MGHFIRIVVVLAVCGLDLSAAYAGQGWNRHDGARFAYAKVTDVQPVYRVVRITTPQETCWNEQVSRTVRGGRYSATPTLLGGILGGVVGSQFGGGRGQTAMTVAGTLLGASLGRDAAYRRRPVAQTIHTTERRCEIEEVVHEEERLEGYRVKYRYQGHDFVTVTGQDPGNRIRVRVQVDPVNRRFR